MPLMGLRLCANCAGKQNLPFTIFPYNATIIAQESRKMTFLVGRKQSRPKQDETGKDFRERGKRRFFIKPD